jgi:hypothetical protein
MNIGALPELLVSWLKTQGAELLQPGKAQPAAGQFLPGHQYDAKVLDNLPSGRSLVRVGQQLLDMPLPQQARPGDSVRLTFLHATNRPTFLLEAAPSANLSQVRLSEAVQQVNALVRFAQAPAAAGPAQSAAGVPAQTAQAAQVQTAPTATVAAPARTAVPAAAGSSVSVSPAASQAAALSQAPGQAGAPTAQTASAPSAAVPSTPGQAAARPIVPNPAVLLAAPAASAPTLASSPALPAMAMAGQAVEGMRPALAANTALATQGAVSQTSPGVHVLAQQLQKAVAESGLFYENHLARWAKGELPLQAIQREPQALLREMAGTLLKQPGLEGMPEEAARLAGRQLMMLEGGPFLWQGLAWPGQWLQWRVEEHPGDGRHPEDAMPRWRTQLRLTLPRLGEVSAELGVGAQGLQIRLTAPNAETLVEMNAALPELAEGLRAADLKLTSLALDLAGGQRE